MTGSPSRRAAALVPVLVFVATVVAVISSLGAPLIPTIADVEQVSLADAQWSLTITLLVGAVAAPAMGRLGDGPWRREVILVALAVVLAGSVLAALPLGYGVLVAGRALQGIGLGLTPLTIAVARDALPDGRSRPAVALLSITTVAGVGLGYPLTGLVAQTFGLHAAYWFGAIVSLAALVAAAAVVPSTRDRASRPLDVPGALMLSAALAGLLLALSEAERWGWTSVRLSALAGAAVLLLLVWVRHELRTPSPLVDLRLVLDRSVLTANVTALLAGVGMYLLLSLITRFVQTPTGAGYGFGASVVVAGLVLLPFSLASVAASKVVPAVARRTSADLVLPLGAGLFLVAMLGFGTAHDALWQVLVVMTISGLAVGSMFAAMPGLIVRGVPAQETASAMSFNQVLRYVGYSTGSALSATVLEAHTPAGQALPVEGGYATAAAVGSVVWVAAVVVSLALPRRRAAVGPALSAQPGAAAGGAPRTVAAEARAAA